MWLGTRPEVIRTTPANVAIRSPLLKVTRQRLYVVRHRLVEAISRLAACGRVSIVKHHAVKSLLPDFGPVPSGGPKVPYEIANRLSRIGYDEGVYHSLNLKWASLRNERTIPGLIRRDLLRRQALQWFSP